MPKLVLFDIDGTLVLTGGAGLRAMNRACEEVVGHRDALDGIPVAGRTDWIILHDALRKIDRDLDEALFASLRDSYIGHLREEIELRGTGVKAVMPGIAALLDELRTRDDVFLALLTGNFEAGARIKLEHFDLWRFFRFGAFGDSHSDRNKLLSIVTALGGPGQDGAGTVVIGDTPHDVAVAKAGGVRSVAVATGSHGVEALRATGADYVFENLSDVPAVLRVLIPSPA